MRNLSMMEAGIGGGTPEEFAGGGVCWLPLYHDMGLVGCLYPRLHYPGTMTYMGPDSFVGRPVMWLQTISKYRGVVSPAPNLSADFDQRLMKQLRPRRLDSTGRLAMTAYALLALAVSIWVMREQGIDWSAIAIAVLAPLIIALAVQRRHSSLRIVTSP